MTLNFGIEPYYDDYDKHKHFYKILFRPAYSLQTRELTQMQTMIQEQVSRMGNHLFKNGTMVIPGELSIDNNISYVKLQPTYNNIQVHTFLSSLVGIVVKGGTTGIRAQVLTVTNVSGSDPDTLYVKYLDGGTAGTTKIFADNETIAPEDTNITGLNVQSATSNSTGVGSSASIKEGVYYINGYFVLCEPQLIILDKYTNTPTYSVGFTLTETIVTPENDESLLDNAQGSYNFAAPGAHRYSIELVLSKKTDINNVNDSDSYIQLVSLINGIAQNVYNQTQYAELAKVMARRTYDESGDYVVRDFKYAVREHRNNSRGAWATGTAYIIGDIVSHGGSYYMATTSATSGSGAGTWPSDELTEFDDGGVKWRFTSAPAYNGGIYTPAQGGLEDHIALAIEPGKAYVRGYEVEKVAMTYMSVPKARSFEYEAYGSIDAIVGNYVLVTNIHAFPDLSKLPSVDLYSAMTTTLGLPSSHGAKIGTARARYFELHSGTIGTASAVYKMGLFNVNLNSGYDFSADVKQLYIDAGMAGTTEDFTADISPILLQQPGTVTVVGSTGVVTGTGTSLMSLRLEDVIKIGTKQYRVTVRTSDSQITVAPSPDTVVDQTVGVAFYLATTDIIEPQNSNLMFGVHPFVRSMRDLSNVNQIRYTVNDVFAGTTNGSGVITFNTTGTNTFASPAIIGNYILTHSDGVVLSFTGDGVNPPVVLSNSNKTCTISTGLNNTYVRVIITCNKMGTVGTEKSKVLTYTSYEVTTSAIGTGKTIKLPNADGVKVYSIKMKSGDWTTPSGTYSIDITNRFTFNSGQTDSFYDLCSISLSAGQSAPIAPFKVIYSYFSHSSTGDYFTVDSYGGPRNASMLSDCLDFRPRIADDGLTFTGTGGSVSCMPKRGYNISSEYTYYLGRIDKLCVEPTGDFHLISGTPAISPAIPATSNTGMLLNTITFSPYTSSTSEVKLEGVDNRRYTMRDIGKLENRITNLEYYTTLSLSEQGVSNMSITDANGLNRYKNGFIVDSFNGHGIGDANSPDYRCSVDADNKTLRPFHVMKNISLYETDINNRSTNHYTLTGDLITLPYTHVAMTTQSFASRVENLNPFAVFTFVGMLDINPQTDNWFETKRLPDIVTNVEGNYNTLLKQMTASGALGTVWNAWQTVWTGTPVKTGTTANTVKTGYSYWWDNWYYGYNYGYNYGWGYYNGWYNGWGYYDWAWGWNRTTTTTTTTYATQVGQTRTGLNTSISPRIDMQQVGETVVTKVVIPYMRSRNVSFVAQGMKSNTKLFAKFDGIDVGSYITPATKITLNNVTNFSNVYDYSSNAGSNSTLDARKIGTNLDLALNKGFIIKGQTSGATAVVLYQEPLATGATSTKLHIINILGTFQINETVIGSLDGGTTGPRGTVAAVPTTVTMGSDLITNYAGVASGIFTIPNASGIQFRTGDRELTLSDSTVSAPTTSSSATYHAVGIIDQSQSTFIATRNASIVQTKVSESQTITNTSTTTSSTNSLCYWDPLAQTFIVDSSGGVFVTKVDLFFFSKETVLSTPVKIEIREVVNGMPSSKVAPFSIVYKNPSEITTSSTGSVPTTFTFPSPVYLSDGVEYALVVMSDSNNYKVFISQMGEVDIATNKLISKQPTLGVLFKSSNGSTWESNQLQDLKYTMYRASFNTAVTGNVNICNGPTESILLGTDPINITNGSTIIRVSHPDHQMPAGSKVQISGSTGVGNVPANEINGQHIIANVDQDSYTFTCTTSPTSTISGGGTAVIATENVQFDTLQVNTSELNFQNTTIAYQIKSTSGQSVDGTETPYVKDASFKTFQANHNVDFAAPRMVGSALNETYLLSGAKSLEVLISLNSSQDTVSPVIDIQRLSAVLVNNKLNNPTLANTNVNAIDDRSIVSVANKIAFSATYNSVYTAIANTAEYNALQTLAAGKYINISSSGATANSGDNLVTGSAIHGTDFHVILTNTITTEATSANVITIVQHQRFVDEISPMYGSAYNKYISQEIILTQPSSYIKTTIAANIPPAADVNIYYRTNPVGATAPLQTLNWIKTIPTQAIIKSTTGAYSDINIDIPNVPSFDSMQVKVVMTSNSTSQVPSCKELRIIACA